jgi:hypothetical protein
MGNDNIDDIAIAKCPDCLFSLSSLRRIRSMFEDIARHCASHNARAGTWSSKDLSSGSMQGQTLNPTLVAIETMHDHLLYRYHVKGTTVILRRY